MYIYIYVIYIYTYVYINTSRKDIKIICRHTHKYIYIYMYKEYIIHGSFPCCFQAPFCSTLVSPLASWQSFESGPVWFQKLHTHGSQ